MSCTTTIRTTSQSPILMPQLVFLMTPISRRSKGFSPSQKITRPVQGDADIPEDPQVAFKSNALKVTRIDAVAQVKSMVALVDDIAATALQSMVREIWFLLVTLREGWC